MLLPGAELLGAEHTAPARALADAGAICVLATDANPGRRRSSSLPIVIVGLAVRRYGWSAREALPAVTLNAAWVLGRSASSARSSRASAPTSWCSTARLEHVPYRLGHNPVPRW